MGSRCGLIIDENTLQGYSDSLGWQNGLESGRAPGTNSLTILFPSLPNPTLNYAKKSDEDAPRNQREITFLHMDSWALPKISETAA